MPHRLQITYEQLLETIQEGIWVIDENSMTTFVNPRMAKILGYSPEEMIGMSLFDFIDEEELKNVEKNVERRKKGLADNHDSRLKHKEGHDVFVELKTIPLLDDNGKYIGAIAGVTDITILRNSERKFRSYMEEAPIGIFVADSEGTYLELNNKALEMTGFTEKEILKGKKSIKDFLAPDSLLEGQAHFESLKREGYARGDFLSLDKDGNVYNVEIIATTILDHGRYIGFVTDTTERRRADSRYKKLIGSMPSAFAYHKVIYDKNGEPVDYRFEDINDRFMEYTGLDRSVIGKTVLEVLPDTDQFFIETYGAVSKGGESVRFERYVESARKWYSILAYSYERDYFAVVFNDITERKIRDEQIHYLTFHNGLTGLYNREYFDSALGALETDTSKLPVAIIALDLNGLKIINDTYGHLVGDEFLKETAEVIKMSCREGDIISRWGGDEFMVLLPNTNSNDAQEVGKRIQDNCLLVNIRGVSISVAMGISVKGSEEEDLVSVLKEAENEMYRNKLLESQSHRSHIVFTLLKTLADKSFETEQHAINMQSVARAIAERIDTLHLSDLNRLNLVVMLHDLGKINLSESILNNTSSLSEEEWEAVKKHPEVGYRILRSTDEFLHLAEEVLYHHERWDGDGYPHGLSGEDIPLLSRIVAIADAYEIMSNGRPYKEKMSRDEIIAEIERCSGSQFDPTLCDIALTLLREDGI